jgi:hypothetical protein
VALGAFTAFLDVEAARAAWPDDPYRNVPLCTAEHAQVDPAITTDGAGGAIVTWQDARRSVGIGSDADIYAQRVDGNGVTRWAQNGVGICTADKHQISPAIVADGAGGAIILWSDARGGGPLVTYAQRVNASGTPLWSPNGIAVCRGFGGQMNLSAVADGAGGAIVAWQDGRGGAGFDIYAQRIDGTGALRWASEGVALCTAAAIQANPVVASDGAGGAIVAWEDSRGLPTNVYAQRVDANGTRLWSLDGVPVCRSPRGGLAAPTIATDGAGGAIVAWQDRRSGAADVYAQRIGSSGSTQWADDGVALCTAPGDQIRPAIASDDTGGVIVTWESHGNPASSEIVAQRVQSNGALFWGSDGVTLCPTPGRASNPTLGADGSGGAIVSWEDGRGGTSDIYVQRMSPAGAAQWTPGGVAICTADKDQAAPRLVSDGGGGAILTWEDLRGDSGWDVYAQRVDRTGKLGGGQ